MRVKMTQKELAIAYASAGVSVFPCRLDTKAPLTQTGHLAASTDKKKIAKWWDKNPTALIGAGCSGQFTVIDFDFVKDPRAIGWFHVMTTQFGVNSPFEVTTGSGGAHLYFKSSDISRRIKILGGVDVLGTGGYTILPDGKNYTIDDIDAFIGSIGGLPSVPSLISNLCESNVGDFSKVFESLSCDCRVVKSMLDSEQSSRLKTSFDSAEKKPGAGDISDADNKEYLRQKTERDKTMYRCNETPVETEKKNWEMVDGAYYIPPGGLEKGDFNHLFYHPDNQRRMATYLGIPLPTIEKSVTFKSLLRDHEDKKPSMGARWAESGNHIIIRDFSNFFDDAAQHLDYNLVRLLIHQRYSDAQGSSYHVKTVGQPEFTAWGLRLMHESGVIMIDQTDTPDGLDGLSPLYAKTMKSFYYLNDIRRLWCGYSGSAPFSKRFSAAWSGISGTSVLLALKELKNRGIIVKTGKTGDGKFDCTLYAIGETKINKKSPDQSQLRSYSKMAQDQLPLGIIFGAEIDSAYKETMANFCQDFEIETIIEKQYMALVIATSEFAQELKPVLPGPIVISNFMMYTLEEEGRKSLLVGYESNMVNKIFDEITKWFEVDEEEADKTFVLCYDYNGKDDDTTMNELSYQFNQYFPMIEASQEITGYYSEEEIDRFVFGSGTD
jgi:hypothetical protein